MFGLLSTLLAFRLTEFPQNREGYKKVKPLNREDSKNYAIIYPCAELELDRVLHQA